MIFRETFPQQAQMNELETVFKSLWKEHPEMNLNFPHPQEYYTEYSSLPVTVPLTRFPPSC